MSRVIRLAGITIVLLALTTAASAQVVQSVHFGLGYFRPLGVQSRVPGDVLVEDLFPTATPDLGLAFDVSDFSAGKLFGEWTIGWHDRFEFGVGASFYGQTVHSVYRDMVNELPSGARIEIEQDLRLRVLPVTALVRVLAFRPGSIQPYIGGGISAVNWRYSEVGEFVDSFDYTVFPDNYVADGTDLGGVFVAGVRWPIKGDIYGLTTEYRFAKATGDTGGTAAGFLSDKIDLGGHQWNFGFLIRF